MSVAFRHVFLYRSFPFDVSPHFACAACGEKFTGRRTIDVAFAAAKDPRLPRCFSIVAWPDGVEQDLFAADLRRQLKRSVFLSRTAHHQLPFPPVRPAE